MHALVTGGGGFLGRAITEMLLERGDSVDILSRSRYPEMEEMGARSITHDLSYDDTNLTAHLEGVDTIFHVAARAGIWGSRETFWSINVDGTRRLLDAARAVGVKQFLYTSSPSAVWSGHDEVNLSEADCAYPSGYLAIYPETKAAAEKMVLAENRDDFRTAALRPHLIWGPRDPHLIPRLLDRGRKGRLRIVGSGDNQVGITYVDNAAWAHLLAADELAGAGKNAGKAYFITDDEPVALWSWINELFTALDVPPVTHKISTANAVRAGAAAEWIWRTFGRSGEPPMTRFVARQLSTHHYYDLSAARADFGYEQKTEPQVGSEGWNKMIAWFQAT